MKKKIALLLAFTMMLSLLPMSVFADAPGGQLSGLPTGALWERTLGRATNLRHWDRGVLVAQPENVRIFTAGNFSPSDGVGTGSWNTDSDSGTRIVPDSGGNLRSVLASMDYFRDQPDQYAASIRTQIYNARGFMGTLFNGAPGSTVGGSTGFYKYGFNLYNNSSISINYFENLVMTRAWKNYTTVTGTRSNPDAPYTPNSLWGYNTDGSNSGSGDTSFDNNTSTSAASVGVGSSYSNDTIRDVLGIGDFTNLWNTVAGTEYLYNLNGTNVTALTRLTAAAQQWESTKTSLDAAIATVNTVVASGMSGSSFTGNLTAVNDALKVMAGVVSGYDADVPPTAVGNSPTVSSIPTNVSSSSRRLFEYYADYLLDGGSGGVGAGTLPGGAKYLFDQARMYTSIYDWVEVFGGLGAHVQGVLRQDNAGNALRTPILMLNPETNDDDVNQNFIVALLPRFSGNAVSGPVNSSTLATEVDMVLIRTSIDLAQYTGTNTSMPQVRVPIEYVTNSDTNSNPVYLTFTHRSTWPQAGESGGRTYLTSNQENRFTVGLYEEHDNDEATPRTFHRYGRALVPGIRIAEAVQSAFDQRDWWVELEISTPGFYWSLDSADEDKGNPKSAFESRFRTRFQNATGSNAQVTANDIRPVTLIAQRAERMPKTGQNQHTTIQFPVRLDGVQNNLERQVNDWLQIDNLSIGATDRARIGDVVVDVRLYRLGTTGESNQGYWQWQPYPLTGDGTTPTGKWGNDAFPSGPSGFYPDENPGNVVGAVTTYFINASGQRVAASTPHGPTGIVGQFTWIRPPQGSVTNGRGGDAILDVPLTVARFGEIGLELFVHEDDDLEDFNLRTGVRNWAFIAEPSVGETRPIGAVLPDQSDFRDHKTVRVVLRETAPGSLPATGANPTVYRFNEGIQVLGVKLWANEAHFSAGHDDNDAEVWFGGQQRNSTSGSGYDNNYNNNNNNNNGYYNNQTGESDNFLNASIDRNSLTIRPEIGQDADRRWRLAEIWAEFYISVQPGYESLYGEDIDITVTSGTVDAPFEGELTVAYAWDPIKVTTENVVLDENNIEAAFGAVRGIDISDVVIEETRAGELVPGQRIWLGLEGGISRGWGSSDHTALRAGTVTVEPADSGLQVSQIAHDSHGSYVEIMRGTRGADGATITFSDIQVSGRVIPDHQYNIIVADTAAAHNWEGWGWINAQQSDVGFTRGLVRGFFNEEPYITPAFKFEGNDFYAPVEVLPGEPGGGGSDSGTTTPVPPTAPAFPIQTIYEGQQSFTSIRTPGRVYNESPPLLLLRNPSNPDFVTSYVMFAVIADLLGVEGQWDEATSTAIFSDNSGNSVSITNGNPTAMVNGQPRQITASGLPAAARIEQGRFYVPINFFNDVVPEFPIVVQWNDPPGGPRSITIIPR